jgi:hypothetical protein
VSQSQRMRIVEAPVADHAPPDLWDATEVTVTSEIVPVSDVEAGRSWTGRVLALTLLTATFVALAWGSVQVYHLLTDAWIAPLRLSPDSDVVAQLRMQHQRQLAELARLDAEITRVDGELEAIDAAVDTLSALRGSAQATLTWQAEQSRVEAGGLDTAAALLDRQRALLNKLLDRQRQLVARAGDDLAAGLIDRTALDREEQIGDQLALELTEIERQLAEAKVRRTHTRSALRALRAGTGQGDAPAIGQMPEVAAGVEHAARVEVELQRLLAEARGQRALRAVAMASVAAQRELLAELESRPLYRAMSAATDIAFVPYDQLAGVRPGARIVDCVWGVVHCHEVGRIAEVLPGEVVTQDPWGELARGQYAILALDDAGAVRERVLRVRP